MSKGLGVHETQMLPARQLVPHPANPPRRVSGRHAETLEASIRAVGIIQPIVVRPHPDGPKGSAERWQILSGHRRWAAACAIGMEQVPCQVRPIDDASALEILVVDNLEREDLSPLEEAHGVDQLVHAGWSLETIADRLGRPAGWVRRRAQIAKLSSAWVSKIESGTHPVSKWGAELLEQIARLPHEMQNRILAEDQYMFNRSENIPSKADLSRYLRDEVLHELSGAPWASDDETLVPKAGSCTACTKRSTADPLLFEDLNPGKKKLGQCLDRACYETKRRAYMKIQFESAKKQHQNLVILRDGGGHGCPGLALDGKNGAGVKTVTAWEFRRVAKTYPKAVPAIVDGGRHAGELIYVARATGGGGGNVAGGQKDKPARPAAETRELRRRKIVLDTLVDFCDSAHEDHVEYFLKHQASYMWRWAATLGPRPDERSTTLASIVYNPKIRTCAKGKEEADAQYTVATEIIGNLRRFVAAHTMDDVVKKWVNAVPLCELLGIGLAKLQAEALVEIPEPAKGKPAKAAEPPAAPAPKRKLKAGKKQARGTAAKQKTKAS